MALETVTSRKKKLWSFDQLIAEKPEANQPTELWDGELIMTPSPTSAHQAVVARLVHALSDFVAQHQLGQVYFAPLDVVFTQRRVVQPDIIFIPEAETIEVLALQEGGYRLTGRSVPGQAARSLLLMGFEISVDEILG